MYSIVKVNNLTHELTLVSNGERMNVTIPETHRASSETKKKYIESFLATDRAHKEAVARKATLTSKFFSLAPYFLATSVLEAIVIIALIAKDRLL